jgi:hypothetical protein
MNAASAVVAAKNKSFIVSCMSSTLRLILSTYALLFCFVKTARLLVQQNLGIKKIPVVTVPDRPHFFLPTLLFFQRD